MKILLLVLSSHVFSISVAQEFSNSDSVKRKENKALIYYGDQPAIHQEEVFEQQDKPKPKGHLRVIEEDSLQLLIEGYKEQKQIEGYKIQLFSGRSRMEAVKVKSSFHSKYGESESADIVYQQPNFKIRVGNYRDRLAANKWLEIYKIDFPSSFIVKDVIKIDQKR